MSERRAAPIDCTGRELATDPKAVSAHKKALPVQVRFAANDGTLATLEGPVRFRAGDALLTGAAGEAWPVERHEFDQRYRSVHLHPDGSGGVFEHRGQPVRARRMDAAFSVRVGSAGDTLQGRPGDWLVQYGPRGWGVVAAEIFAATYAITEPPGAAAGAGPRG